MNSTRDCTRRRATPAGQGSAPPAELDHLDRAQRDRVLDADFAAQMRCPHGRNLDEELCERCAEDDAELDAL